MNLRIPDDLEKYCSLSEDESIIDCFVCPIDGCDYTTRLGPGAIRMHILLRSDPSSLCMCLTTKSSMNPIQLN